MIRDRRSFIAAGSLGLLAFRVGGTVAMLTPREARAQGATLGALTAAEAATIEALGETLLPGAVEAGIVAYLDQQLGAEAAQSLLMIRYLDVPPPWLHFYRPALAAVDASAQRAHGRPFHALAAPQQHDLVAGMQAQNPEGWQGPPAPLFYFVLRSDVVDVVYGTEEGFARLGVPYRAHIRPPSRW